MHHVLTRILLAGPDIVHGSLAQYQYNGTGTEAGQFAEAVYECEEGHSLADPRISSLFCQNGTWRGEMPRCVASPGLESGAGDRVWCDQGDMGECEQLCFTQGELTCGQNIITLIPEHAQEVRSSVSVTPGTHWLQMVTSARTLMSAR